jgi:hypothetical protein
MKVRSLSFVLFLLSLTTLLLIQQVDAVKEQLTTVRPQLVQDALATNKPLYYFGLGSNMLRSKLENRSSQGKIRILRMEAAIVKGHRLAFNMRGFPPIEPGMGSLEPLASQNSNDDQQKSGRKDKQSKALLQYKHDECHGALVKLRPIDYERVMLSEGVSNNSTNAGYEEIVVTAYPYGRFRKPVQAVALRARSHVRLSADPCPSQRYMNILKEGAEGLGLKQCYQDFLATHPVQEISSWLRDVAVYNLIVTSTLSFRFKMRFVSRFQSWLLFLVYVPSNANGALKFLSNMATLFLLLPGAAFGFVAFHIMSATGTLPPMVTRIMSFVKPVTEKE